MKIKTKRSRPIISGGTTYRPGADGYVEIPDEVAREEGYGSSGEAKKSSEAKVRLVERAVELGVGSPSQLERWGEDRLRAEIEKAEAAASGSEGDKE